MRALKFYQTGSLDDLHLEEVSVPIPAAGEVLVEVKAAAINPSGATVTADKLPIEDILTVKHDVVPLDGTDVFQQGEIDSIGSRVAVTENTGDFRRLPVDDARQDQVQAAASTQSADCRRGRSYRPRKCKIPRQSR